MTGDTLINDVQYKKVYWRDLVFNYGLPPFEPEGPYYLRGFIRDDTANRKVYAIDLNTDMLSICPENEEYLMFDFSYEIGDTVNFCTYPSIYSIDTINDIVNEFIYGVETKAFVLSNLGYTYYEGIGSDFGLFETMFETCKKNSKYVTITYLDYYCPDDTCGLVVSIPKNEEANKFIVYPNPADELLRIRLSKSIIDGSVELYDICGHRVKKIHLHKNCNNIEIWISDLKQGIYFAVLIENGVITNRTKILIK